MATQRNASSKRTPSRTAGTRPRPSAATPIGPSGSPLAGVPTKYHNWIFVGLILLALLIFFGPVIFSGKVFNASDNISWESFRPYLSEMDKRGEIPHWIPYIFSGMPGFAALLVTGNRWWDLIMKGVLMGENIFGVVNYPVMRMVMYYFLYGLGMYLLMRSKQAARSTSLFVALAAIFSTWIIIYIMIGHNTKIMVLMTFPYIFLCLEQLIKRWSLLYTGLLIAAIHVFWESAHLQTAFYGACAIGIYLVFELIGAALAKEKVANVLVTAAMVAVAGAFAYGMGMDRNLAVQEYLPYSTRGAAAITADPQHTEGAMEVGHGYEYATNWSFSIEELITYVVPAYFGFGKVSYTGPETGNQPQQVMTYWGQMPFTDAAHYMGIGVLILGVFGAWMNRRNRFVQALVVIGFFGMLLSFGKNFSILFDLFYNWVPGFNKFRAPSQSLVLLEFVFPILAGFGIETLLAMNRAGDNPGSDRTLLMFAGFFGAFTLIGALGQSALKSGYMASLAAAKTTGQYPASLQESIFNMMIGDWIICGMLGVATLLLMYFYVKGRLTPTVLKIGLLAILLIDLWRVDYRPMDYAPEKEVMSVFNSTDVDAFVKQEKDKYRMMDLTRHPNYPAYHFEENIIGYHAAKLRNYQDLLDIAGNGDMPTAPLAWHLLNAKYIIAEGPIGGSLRPVFTSREKKAVVLQNDSAMPRAWFVNRVEVADGRTVLTRIKENAFNPWDVAYVSSPLATQISPAGNVPAGIGGAPAGAVAPHDSTMAADTSATGRMGAAAMAAGAHPLASKIGGTVKITRYEPLHIAMEVDAPGPGSNFLVISEINYPPSWHATIDGKEVEIVGANYLLRGLVVPAGKHTIEMNYVSHGFETGKWASLGLNLVTLGTIAFGFVLQRRNRKEDPDPRHDAPVIEEDDV